MLNIEGASDWSIIRPSAKENKTSSFIAYFDISHCSIDDGNNVMTAPSPRSIPNCEFVFNYVEILFVTEAKAICNAKVKNLAEYIIKSNHHLIFMGELFQ